MLQEYVSLSGDPQSERVAVLAGVGGNGGGALVCARRLANWGADVQVLVTRDEDRFKEIPQHQLRILRAMGLPIAMTLALPKKGLRSPAVRERVGELYLADIGVPPALYGAKPLELEVGAIFAESEIVEVVLCLA